MIAVAAGVEDRKLPGSFGTRLIKQRQERNSLKLQIVLRPAGDAVQVRGEFLHGQGQQLVERPCQRLGDMTFDSQRPGLVGFRWSFLTDNRPLAWGRELLIRG